MSVRDLTGQIFGEQIVLRRASNKGSMSYWIVQCSCENKPIRAVQGASLTRTKQPVKSCGCIRSSAHADPNRRIKNIGLNGWMLKYKNSANRRNYIWELTPERFEQLSQKNCYYCNAKPVTRKENYYRKFAANGIDRIDNNKGYTIKNSVACCSICNLMKRTMSVDEFLAHCRRILEYMT